MTEITVDEARKMLETARTTRLKDCWAEINAVLKKHGCRMAVHLSIVDGRIIGNTILMEDTSA